MTSPKQVINNLLRKDISRDVYNILKIGVYYETYEHQSVKTLIHKI